MKNIIDTDLKPSIDTDNPQNRESTYKQTRAVILSDYNSGKRDKTTIQPFLYLASLENNVAAYEKASQEWCQKNESECVRSKNTVTFSGIIKDNVGKAIPDVEIFVSGSQKIHTFSAPDGSYKLSFETLNPRRIRIVLRHDLFAGWSYTAVTLDPALTNDIEQLFKKDFVLTRPEQELTINTGTKKIMSWVAQVNKDGFTIANDFSKYYIPFESIKTQDRKPYKGIVKIKVFEFDRETANEFLTSDVFDEIHGFASEGLQTYSMPLIFFYDASGNRLEVFQDAPMTVWTTNRELAALINEMSARPDMPWFNPAEYDEWSSPENVAKKIKADEEKAYMESQKNIDNYPLTYAWLLENFSRLPGFFVFDQSTGMWENTGFSLVAPSTDILHSIQAPFWTKK